MHWNCWRRFCRILGLTVVSVSVSVSSRAHDEASLRSIELTSHVRVRGSASAEQVRLWIPVPQSSPSQSVSQMVRHQSFPLQRRTERRYGNSMLYGQGAIPAAGTLDFEIAWNVKRQETRLDNRPVDNVLSGASRSLWLRGSPKIPIGGRPLNLIDASKLPIDPRDKARMFYDRVLDHMQYDKSRPGYGTGDAVWACDSRFGNCTDFHSLFMSLARTHDIPARFEIGYPLPSGETQGEIRGYHCWAWFHDQKQGWTPVDISEANKRPEFSEYYFGNLSADRIAFSVGRDLELEPPQQGPALNYFVAPYAEVNGVPVDGSDVEFSLSFRDVSARTRK